MSVRRPALAALVLLALAPVTGPAFADDVLDGHARRGAVYLRIAMEDLTPPACAALCDGDSRCRSWVWTRAELTGSDASCALLSAAPTPYAAPGQVTGLSRDLRDRLEAVAERAPAPRELLGLRAVQAGPD